MELNNNDYYLIEEDLSNGWLSEIEAMLHGWEFPPMLIMDKTTGKTISKCDIGVLPEFLDSTPHIPSINKTITDLPVPEISLITKDVHIPVINKTILDITISEPELIDKASIHDVMMFYPPSGSTYFPITEELTICYDQLGREIPDHYLDTSSNLVVVYTEDNTSGDITDLIDHLFLMDTNVIQNSCIDISTGIAKWISPYTTSTRKKRVYFSSCCNNVDATIITIYKKPSYKKVIAYKLDNRYYILDGKHSSWISSIALVQENYSLSNILSDNISIAYLYGGNGPILKSVNISSNRDYLLYGSDGEYFEYDVNKLYELEKLCLADDSFFTVSELFSITYDRVGGDKIALFLNSGELSESLSTVSVFLRYTALPIISSFKMIPYDTSVDYILPNEECLLKSEVDNTLIRYENNIEYAVFCDIDSTDYLQGSLEVVPCEHNGISYIGIRNNGNRVIQIYGRDANNIYVHFCDNQDNTTVSTELFSFISNNIPAFKYWNSHRREFYFNPILTTAQGWFREKDCLEHKYVEITRVTTEFYYVDKTQVSYQSSITNQSSFYDRESDNTVELFLDEELTERVFYDETRMYITYKPNNIEKNIIQSLEDMPSAPSATVNKFSSNIAVKNFRYLVLWFITSYTRRLSTSLSSTVKISSFDITDFE